MDTSTADLHRLIDQLPPKELLAARRFLEFLRARHEEERPHGLTSEQEEGLLDAIQSLKRGEGIPAAEVFSRARKIAP